MRAIVGGANVNHAYTGPAAAQQVAEAEAHARPGGPSGTVQPTSQDEGVDGITVLHLTCRVGPPVRPPVLAITWYPV